jgi:orotate phosphoribosyltransferase-like protein
MISIFQIYNKPIEKAGIRVFIKKSYKKGFKTYEISQAIGTSTRTVWKIIIKARNGKKITRKGWVRNLPKNWRLIGVKIRRISILQNAFLKTMEWVKKLATKTMHIDLEKLIEAILSGKPV